MSIFSKRRILHILKSLEGINAVSMGRAADMVWIAFDNSKMLEEGKETKKKDYSLHISTPCRITQGNEIIIGSFNIYLLSEEAKEDDWDTIGSNVYDVKVRDKINPIFPVKVVKVNCNDIGDIEIILENGMIITVFVQDYDDESWRLIDNVRDKHYINSELQLKCIERELILVIEAAKFCRAIKHSNIQKIEKMLKNGQDVNVRDSHGVTALQLAVIKGDFALVKMFVKYGADINAIDDNFRTALFYAKVRQSESIIKFLLDNGACTDIVDYSGISISDLDDDEIRDRLYNELYGFE